MTHKQCFHKIGDKNWSYYFKYRIDWRIIQFNEVINDLENYCI